MSELAERITLATFWKHVEKRGEAECWPWRGQDNRGYGYVQARHPKQKMKATHIMLAISGRPRPEGAHALHSCDNPSCVNPAHLRWGTIAENHADRVRRGRSFRPVGELSPSAKLTNEIVLMIRSSPRPSKEFAEEYGVSDSVISHIRSRKTWKHI